MKNPGETLLQVANKTKSAGEIAELNRQLSEAAKRGDTEVVKSLCARGAKVDAKIDASFRTPLMFAAAAGHTETVLVLAEELGANVNARGPDRTTPLMFAAATDHTETVRVLIQLGADVNAKNRLEQDSLMLTARAGHTETVLVLIELGADVNAQGKYGSALTYAIRKGHAETARILTQHGATINTKTININDTAIVAFLSDMDDGITLNQMLTAILLKQGQNLQDLQPLLAAGRVLTNPDIIKHINPAAAGLIAAMGVNPDSLLKDESFMQDIAAFIASYNQHLKRQQNPDTQINIAPGSLVDTLRTVKSQIAQRIAAKTVVGSNDEAKTYSLLLAANLQANAMIANLKFLAVILGENHPIAQEVIANFNLGQTNPANHIKSGPGSEIDFFRKIATTLIAGYEAKAKITLPSDQMPDLTQAEPPITIEVRVAIIMAAILNNPRTAKQDAFYYMLALGKAESLTTDPETETLLRLDTPALLNVFTFLDDGSHLLSEEESQEAANAIFRQVRSSTAFVQNPLATTSGAEETKENAGEPASSPRSDGKATATTLIPSRIFNRI